MHPATENLSITKSTTTKKLYPRNTKKKSDPRNTHEKNFGSTKYLREKTLDPRIPTRKYFGPTNTHEKSIRPTKYPREKILYSQNTTKKIGPTKYLRMHDRTIVLNPQDLR